MKIKVFLGFVLVLSYCTFLPVKAKSDKSSLVKLPLRVAAFTIGTAIGTPIALVRCVPKELVKQTKTAYTLGGVPKPLGYVSAAVFGIPSGFVSAAWTGTANGVADSWVNSKDAPFGKASFSLDKLEF